VRDYIGTGVVLDAVARSTYCFSQIEQLLEIADRGLFHDGDVIYLDDFWTPGLEALPYLLDQIGAKVKVYSFLFAQSVDEYDFTYKMRRWMRPMEVGYASMMDGIFVAHPLLKELVVGGGIAPEDKVFVSGHPFCSEEVAERMPWRRGPWEMKRQDKVVFSSRWDDEKNPLFFLRVAALVKRWRPEARFVICTGSQKVRSNNHSNLVKLAQAEADGIVEVREGLSKEEYYQEVAEAKVQMNTALQDFVPLTLLEASVAGTYPVYPYFRSFPDTFRHMSEYLYQAFNEEAAAAKIIGVLNRDDLWTETAIEARSWIHTRFDVAWKRQLVVMGLLGGKFDEPR
jgi:glycosyltransferase involved in cell wall biosynthesis